MARFFASAHFSKLVLRLPSAQRVAALTCLILLFSSAVTFAEPSPRDACLLGELRTATPEQTVKELRDHCAGEADIAPPATEPGATPDNPDSSLIGARINREEVAQTNRSTLVPHRRNYFVPISYMEDPNEQPYQDAGDSVQDLDHAEMKFQLSLKASLLQSLLTENDQLYFGFTMLSYWQAFNSQLSAPFRETNYEPEFFYVTPLPWKPFNIDATLLSFGF
jgi:phospholipase A1